MKAKLPFYLYLSPKDQEVFNDEWPAVVKWYALTIQNFAVPNERTPTPVVYKLPDAPHYFHLSEQSFVVRVMREFLLGNE